MKFNRSRATSCRQRLHRSVSTVCAFEDLARDVPARRVAIVVRGQELAGLFQSQFHIRLHLRTKAVRKHVTPHFPSLITCRNYTDQIERGKTKNKGESRTPGLHPLVS